MRRAFTHFIELLVVFFGSALLSQAQTFTTLYNFSGVDGDRPMASLLLTGKTLYGTTKSGGPVSLQLGTVFSINIDGTDFTNLYSFTGANDGSHPLGHLIQAGTLLYGTASSGGASGYGTVFSLSLAGTGFRTIHSFTGLDGENPECGLALSGGVLYGTTFTGGDYSQGPYLLQYGTVFMVNLDGTGFETLITFDGASNIGANPVGGVVPAAGTLYGTDSGGGIFGGSVFAANPDYYKILHTFSGSDGFAPVGDLILSGTNLYGTTSFGGQFGNGTIFKIDTEGSRYSVLCDFSGADDGTNPQAGLVMLGMRLYGAAANGGSFGYGTLFAINADGTGFTNLYEFTGGFDGAYPLGGLIASGNILYGTTSSGGESNNGTVFSLALASGPPLLTIAREGENVILTWPTNFTGFTLQSTANLTSPVWTTNLPAPVVVNGQNTVTNPISGNQQLFRLSQ